MNRKSIIILLLAGACILAWLLFRPAKQADQANLVGSSGSASNTAGSTVTTSQGASPQTNDEIVIPDLPGANLSADDKLNIAKIVKAFTAPISFWGKVVDQNGDPVPHADVLVSVESGYFQDGVKSQRQADALGLFSILGEKGGGLYVRASKPGYYHISGKSGRSFGYGTASGDAPPGPGNPALFALRKMGECEPLVWLESASVFVPKDGTPFGISLRHRTAKLPSSSVKPDIVVEVWNDYANHDESLRHDWRCRIWVPSGGLVEREGQFDFEAPADGYREEIAVSKPRTMERWNAQFRDEFFVKLHDGCFARIEIQVSAALDTYVLVKSHLNPVPGHRNLEFDPAKAIKPAE